MPEEIIETSIRKVFYVDDFMGIPNIINKVTEMYAQEMLNIDPNLLTQKTVEGVKSWSSQEWRQHRNMVFDSQGEGSWSPNRGRYAEWKREKYPNVKILELTGTLKNSYIGEWKIQNMGSVIQISSYVPNYALYHQTGTPPPNWRNVVPFLKRKFHYLTDSLVKTAGQKIGKRVVNSIVKKIRAQLGVMNG